ncbi:MAG TPA: alpha/beta hydrolase [Baekduia sp.]|nr:alpha/beta hydrolase [Baekduia sp.]
MSLVFRETRPEGEARGTLLCVHGFPESSHMFGAVLEAAAAAGWHAVAPDLPGSGDTPPDRPQTWERQVEALGRFVEEQDLGPVVLCAHDWGALIGLRWACDAGPAAVRALVISDSGFFPDGKWHGMAKAFRTPGEGEQLMAGFAPEQLGALLRGVSPGMSDAAIAHYARGLETEEHRLGHLEQYRSGDFEKLEPYEGRLAALGVPVLLLWGADDQFAPVAGAHRFARELPDTELVVLEGVGHFVFDDAPEEAAAAVVRFLGRLA